MQGRLEYDIVTASRTLYIVCENVNTMLCIMIMINTRLVMHVIATVCMATAIRIPILEKKGKY